ncbi:transmembrane protein, putative (macronuclear) [Tetrahymena thermophila SB210]|uniref:Transmembrane protein, putative n=1 Tax=Tetrahymena thermophila (strain SB210) TaxID=312017 RepID=W7X1L3_TETTS|nr:transmembrane protein, putative [Tetrahymena thermophila SB210]EWS73130.1 transmembrane protein, putative [Tetrahymena thermophila SB210]|eukprot:XP_012654317.1 transmembrane protein, putative [Tetrahymena thermophila SB210]
MKLTDSTEARSMKCLLTITSYSNNSKKTSLTSLETLSQIERDDSYQLNNITNLSIINQPKLQYIIQLNALTNFQLNKKTISINNNQSTSINLYYIYKLISQFLNHLFLINVQINILRILINQLTKKLIQLINQSINQSNKQTFLNFIKFWLSVYQTALRQQQTNYSKKTSNFYQFIVINLALFIITKLRKLLAFTFQCIRNERFSFYLYFSQKSLLFGIYNLQ